MRETSKAMKRRWREHDEGIFPWKDIFVGRAIDIGSGDDPLKIPEGCRPFDTKDGDANRLSEYFSADAFDLIHASQVLEHMHDPMVTLRDWLSILAPGGNLVVTIPSWELYEGKRARSIYNADHKATFSTFSRQGSVALPHFFIPDDLRTNIPDGFTMPLCRLLAENYDFIKGASVDQTYRYEDLVEPWIEFVIRRESSE